MITALSVLLLGFPFGLFHALDADHVVAVTTIVSRERTIRHAALIGALWGLGHTVTIMLMGGLILLCGIIVPHKAGLALEFSVAVMLVILGLLNLKGMIHRICGSHRNENEPSGSAEAAKNDAGAIHLQNQNPRRGGLNNGQILRPLSIGVVHGLAGSAALALLVLPTIHDPRWALGYLFIFGLGTIAGMIGTTTAMALPLACVVKRSARFHRHLGMAAGFLSAGFGLFLAYQIGFVQGLFTK